MNTKYQITNGLLSVIVKKDVETCIIQEPTSRFIEYIDREIWYFETNDICVKKIRFKDFMIDIVTWLLEKDPDLSLGKLSPISNEEGGIFNGQFFGDTTRDGVVLQMAEFEIKRLIDIKMLKDVNDAVYS